MGGGADSLYTSLSERVLGVEKKSKAFNVYMDFAGALFAGNEPGNNQAAFKAKNLRLEIKGELGEKFYYRFRHRLNRQATPMGQDNLSKATDYMMIGYRITPRLDLIAGKYCQLWGGYEFAENPLFVYQFSDQGDAMDSQKFGVALSYYPVPEHKISVEVSNTFVGNFKENYGEDPYYFSGSEILPLQSSSYPFTYLTSWVGNFLGGTIQTRWSYGYNTLAKGLGGHRLFFGQQYKGDTFQCYLDYMLEWGRVDRIGIVTSDLAGFLGGSNAGNTAYNTLILKSNWRFAPKWNLMLKGMWEKMSQRDLPGMKGYRTSLGYLGSLEFYPDKTQDLRFFLAFIGRSYLFNEASALEDFNTVRMELGFIYRIKCY